MKTVLRKWGNSLGIRIPNMIVQDLDLSNGLQVEIEKDGTKIMISPRQTSKLAELLEGITGQNMHSEQATGRAVGREIW